MHPKDHIVGSLTEEARYFVNIHMENKIKETAHILPAKNTLSQILVTIIIIVTITIKKSPYWSKNQIGVFSFGIKKEQQQQKQNLLHALL